MKVKCCSSVGLFHSLVGIEREFHARMFLSCPCSVLLHQLLAKNKHHSTAIYVQQPPGEPEPPPALLLVHRARSLASF